MSGKGAARGCQQGADEVAQVDQQPVAEHLPHRGLTVQNGQGDQGIAGEEFPAGQDYHGQAEGEKQAGKYPRQPHIVQGMAGGIGDGGSHGDEKAGQYAQQQKPPSRLARFGRSGGRVIFRCLGGGEKLHGNDLLSILLKSYHTGIPHIFQD